MQGLIADDFIDVIQQPNSSILARCFNHWLTATRLERCGQIFHVHINKMKDKVGEFLQKSSSWTIYNEKDNGNQKGKMSSSVRTDLASNSCGQSNLIMESTTVKIDITKIEQADSLASSRRSSGSGIVAAELQRIRENRWKNLYARNERRERIRMQNLARLREQTENAVKAAEKENRRVAREEMERINRRLDQFKRMEALKAKERADRERGEQYHRSLCLRYYGFLPWRYYLQQQRTNQLHACKCDQLRIQRTHFLAWHRLIQEISERKHAMADICYRRILLRRTIYSFSEAVNTRQNLYKMASEFYETTLVKMGLVNWINCHKEIQVEIHHKNQTAVTFFVRTTKRKCFEQMRCYVSISRAEKEREKRLANLRQKVLDIVPDFQPCFSVE